MPLCDLWARNHHLGLRIEELCTHVDQAELPLPVEEPEPELPSPTQDTEAAAVTEIQDVDPNTEIEVMDSSQGYRIPNTYGPCPPGEVRNIFSQCRKFHTSDRS
ncbi:unnamed protein product [Laminaria digitata]